MVDARNYTDAVFENIFEFLESSNRSTRARDVHHPTIHTMKCRANSTLSVPVDLEVGVMQNAADLLRTRKSVSIIPGEFENMIQMHQDWQDVALDKSTILRNLVGENRVSVCCVTGQDKCHKNSLSNIYRDRIEKCVSVRSRNGNETEIGKKLDDFLTAPDNFDSFIQIYDLTDTDLIVNAPVSDTFLWQHTLFNRTVSEQEAVIQPTSTFSRLCDEVFEPQKLKLDNTRTSAGETIKNSVGKTVRACFTDIADADISRHKF